MSVLFFAIANNLGISFSDDTWLSCTKISPLELIVTLKVLDHLAKSQLMILEDQLVHPLLIMEL